MGLAGGPNLKEDGLVFYYDTGNNVKSYKGRPTTNLMEGYGISNYNNVGASVTTVLTATSETYRGSSVIKQTITPLDGSGVSWLTNANNPGIGVVTNGGGGLANRYTGHSIFFKPTSPMYSVPVYTHYSNIGGWQSTGNYEDMGDGWFRAKVLWYDTVTRSDGKYWAINPLSSTVNRPITVYWAGPFKEDLNSQAISQYTPTSRTATQGLLDVTGTSTLDLSNVSFDSNAQMTFDGTDDLLDVTTNFGTLSAYTFEYVVYSNSSSNMPISSRTSTAFYKYGAYSWRYTHGGVGGEFYHTYGNDTGWAHWVITYDGSTISVWENGVSKGTSSSSGTADFSGGIRIGSWTSSASYTWDGTIPIMKMYNRALTAAEVKQNFQGIRNRFNL